MFDQRPLMFLSAQVYSGVLPFYRIVSDFIILQMVLAGQRPSRPDFLTVPDDLWLWIQQSWEADPGKRPSLDLLTGSKDLPLPMAQPTSAGHVPIPETQGSGTFSKPGLPPMPSALRKLLPNSDCVQYQVAENRHPLVDHSSASDTAINEQLPSWKLIHLDLLSKAELWPMAELNTALQSTAPGNQLNELALDIWSAQKYRRHVHTKMTDDPTCRIDCLVVPPSVTRSILDAVRIGRCEDGAQILARHWAPLSRDGNVSPRLVITISKHGKYSKRWVAHMCVRPLYTCKRVAVAEHTHNCNPVSTAIRPL